MFIISDNDFTIDMKNINLKPLTDVPKNVTANKRNFAHTGSVSVHIKLTHSHLLTTFVVFFKINSRNMIL